MDKEILLQDQLPPAYAPYSQIVRYGTLLFISGQVAAGGDSDDPLPGQSSVYIQTEQILKNIRTMLECAGSSMEKVLKCTVYLADKQDFDEMNRAYAEAFGRNYPARVTVSNVGLFETAKVEIDVIAGQ